MTICFETDPRTPPSVFSTPAKRKGQAMVIKPGPNNRVPAYGSGRGHAVLKITFAELLRSYPALGCVGHATLT